ncbi:hypothetical protein N7509_000120 [Penicillium cosmopolitanum]|uniref:Uncharacterized protein n=1 Tax=Penicillium cosmopolitanum TaxID=1131564 RepID=A0A9X0BF87_9EURO|nr:uncharacterized protein N7509_000120 [Penicillium cosmopolitanum]KAJ5415022.1 hypothetical protein N7509_000120 [Penicillium cosmopolitanum]
MIGSLIVTATAKIRCNNYDKCIDHYIPGFGTCPSNYERLVIDIPHQVPQVECQRSCNDNELQKCRADLCQEDIDTCNKNPGWVETCRRALHKCKGPIMMNRDICTDDAMERHVKFSTPSTVMCSIDGAAELDAKAQGENTVVIDLGSYGFVIGPDSDKVLRCAGLSNGGKMDFEAKTIKLWRCQHREQNSWGCLPMPGASEQAEKACREAQAAIGQETVFKVEKRDTLRRLG